MLQLTRYCLAALVAVGIPQLGAQRNENATPNTTDLSKFQGNYFGKSVVTAEDETFRGRTKIRIVIDEGGITGRVRVKGNVRVEGTRVPINNRFQFKKTGRVGISELVPAVTQNERENGFYRASTDQNIVISGKFRVEDGQTRVQGTYSGEIRVSAKRVLRMNYSVTLDEQTSPSFTYKFVAEPRSDD